MKLKIKRRAFRTIQELQRYLKKRVRDGKYQTRDELEMHAVELTDDSLSRKEVLDLAAGLWEDFGKKRAHQTDESVDPEEDDEQTSKKEKSATKKKKWSDYPVLHWRDRWRAVHDPLKLSPITRLVLWEISAHMKNNGRGAYPGFKKIAKGTGLAISTVTKHVELAVDAGWLRRHKIMKKHGKGWIYSIAYPKEPK